MRATGARERQARCALLLLITICRCAPAQDGYGSISGTIFEAGGIPAALASVTLIRQGDGFHRELVADKNGKYESLNLAAGSYEVVAGSVDTGASSRLTVMVNNGQSVELRIVLSTPSAAFVSDALREIPLNGRNYLDLLRNASEATRGEEGGNVDGYTPLSPRGNLSLNIVGQRGQNNNFLLDGLDNNENWLGSPAASSLARIDPVGGP